MSFDDVNLAYENAQRVIENGINGHAVTFPELAIFNEARRRLAREINQSMMHESWNDCLKVINVIHAKIARSPCRPSWLIHEILDNQGGRQVMGEVKQRLNAVDVGVRESFEKLCESLDKLSHISTNPIVDTFGSIQFLQGKSLLVLRDLRLWGEARECLSGILRGCDWEIVKPSFLRNQKDAKRIILFGPLWYICFKHEQYLLRAPAAPEIHLIANAHEFAGDITLSVLGESKSIKINTERPVLLDQNPWDFEPLTRFQKGHLEFKHHGESRMWESGKTVAAIPLRFSDSRGTYFKKDSFVWVVVTGSGRLSHICTQVERIQAEEIEAGSLVLMTTSGGGNMIPYVADLLLPDSNRIRRHQKLWKSELRSHVEKDGMDVTVSKLVALGAVKATATNLKNWCDPRNIGMENLESDLRAVLRLINMEERFYEVLSGIEALRSAHQSAGTILQKKLRESMVGKDVSEVFCQGHLEIKHGDGPAKTVFLVEERGDEAEIPEEWEGELKEIDE